MSREYTTLHPSRYGVGIRPTPGVVLDPCTDRSVDDLENQERVTSWPYYSTVKFRAVRSGASGAFLYTMALPARGIRAFSYGLGDDKTSGGYLAADGQATAADTNIITRNQTIAGQYVEIRGLAFQWHNAALDNPGAAGAVPQIRLADAEFLSVLHRDVSVELGLNGDEQTFKLGTIGMIPGAGGLRGGAPLLTGLAVLDANQDAQFAANGWETRSNFFRVPEGLIWKTSDKPDGNLNIIFRQNNAIQIPAGGSPENQVLATTAAAIDDVSRGYNYPEYLAAELKVFLVGQVLGGRTRSA
jgi:hypothetical protein